MKTEKLKTFYQKIDGMKFGKSFLVLLAVSVGSLLVCLLPFLFRGAYTLWTGGSWGLGGAAKDAVNQHLTFLVHYREEGWLRAIGDYDFYKGLGEDYLTSGSFLALFDPFNIVFFLLPFGDKMNYTLVMALKQLTCAVTIFTYLHYKKVANTKAIILSVAYMLTGFTAFTFVRHYNLTAGPIYLPLAIMGIEKILSGERPYLFIGAVFLCLLTNFYVFFSLSLFCVAYAIAYWYLRVRAEGEKPSVKNFFGRLLPVAGFYLLAVGLAAFMLLPNIYGFFHSARSSSKGLEFFSFDTFFTQLRSLVFPVTGAHYSLMALNLGLMILAVYAFAKRNERTRIYAWFVVALTIGYLLPVFGYAMNIFNYSNNRWSYGLSFFVFVLIALQSKEETGDEPYGKEETAKVNGAVVGYVVLVAAAAFFAFSEKTGWAIWQILVSVLIALAIVVACVLWKKSGKKILLFQKFYRPTVLFSLSFVLTIGCAFGYYCTYSKQFNGSEHYAELFSSQESYLSERNEKEYFRSDSAAADRWYATFSNRGLNNRYYSTKAYNSVSNKYVYEFLKENGVYNPTQNLGISGLDERWALQNLLSTKYTYNARGGYGFTPVQGVEELYENENYVSLGFMTEKTYSKEYYLSLSTLDRQYLLLDGVVLENGKGTADGSYESDFTVETIARGEKGYTLKKGEPLRFSGSGYKNKEIYVVIRGVDEVPQSSLINVTCGDTVKQYSFAVKGNLMYSEQRDIYLHFLNDSDDIEVTIELISGKEVSFKSAELHTTEKAKTQSLLDWFSEREALRNLKVESNKISGTIEANRAGYLLLTIPYSDGWTAYVDGKKTEVVRADTAFIALKVNEGTHAIEFRYETPYLKIGIVGSLVCLTGLAALITVGEIVRHRKKDYE
ncbi:MAG: YfhO family protein [Clostridia bacterium]|nr:YfhO family protein [Clostridia bacterium]